MIPALKTCRFCGMSNFEHNHPAARSFWVRYGTRANAHLRCAVQKKGAQFIIDLPTHALEQLPALELAELGMVPTVRAELAKRGHQPEAA